MGTIVTFLGTHWIWFLIIAILLIFALIGYFVDSNSIEEDRGETMSINNTAKVEGVELANVSGSLNEKINSNNGITTNEQKEEVLDATPQGETSTETLQTEPTVETQPAAEAPTETLDAAPQEPVQSTTQETQPLIDEQKSNVSTFQG